MNNIKEIDCLKTTIPGETLNDKISYFMDNFVNKSMGVGSRVSVELSPESAKLLAETIIKALEKGEKDPQIKISVLD